MSKGDVPLGQTDLRTFHMTNPLLWLIRGCEDERDSGLWAKISIKLGPISYYKNQPRIEVGGRKRVHFCKFRYQFVESRANI